MCRISVEDPGMMMPPSWHDDFPPKAWLLEDWANLRVDLYDVSKGNNTLLGVATLSLLDSVGILVGRNYEGTSFQKKISKLSNIFV